MRENQNETGGRGSKKAVASNTRHVLVPSFSQWRLTAGLRCAPLTEPCDKEGQVMALRRSLSRCKLTCDKARKHDSAASRANVQRKCQDTDSSLALRPPQSTYPAQARLM